MTNNNRATTITLTEATKKSLDELKVHPRQSYEEIIKTLVNQKVKEDLK